MIIDAEADLEVVGEASDGNEAVEMSRLIGPQVVLMDIRMPRSDGIEATRRLGTLPKERRPKVVILTTYDLDEFVFDALAAGASGFLLKDVPPEELVRAIRITAAGDALLSPSVSRRLIEQFVSHRPVPEDTSRLKVLTDRETEVLGYMARGRSNAGNCRGALPRRKHREDPCRPYPRQAWTERPGPSRHPRLRGRARPSGKARRRLLNPTFF